ncbi:hypothetical protein PR048_002602 [Dryococelus australis]|uniref:Uncharacterized protein n=1 Tax=Dryococelus australis TaxID=614101 RepID=A0ABQ9IKM5_9NEOP|nr:hypothetical protein PR048_002602 [Dryococelus australis]
MVFGDFGSKIPEVKVKDQRNLRRIFQMIDIMSQNLKQPIREYNPFTVTSHFSEALRTAIAFLLCTLGYSVVPDMSCGGDGNVPRKHPRQATINDTPHAKGPPLEKNTLAKSWYQTVEPSGGSRRQHNRRRYKPSRIARKRSVNRSAETTCSATRVLRSNSMYAAVTLAKEGGRTVFHTCLLLFGAPLCAAHAQLSDCPPPFPEGIPSENHQQCTVVRARELRCVGVPRSTTTPRTRGAEPYHRWVTSQRQVSVQRYATEQISMQKQNGGAVPLMSSYPFADRLSEVLNSKRKTLGITQRNKEMCLGGIVVSLITSQLGEPCSIPRGVARGFPHVGILPDDAADRRVSSRISSFPSPCITALFHTNIASPSSALKTSTLRATQISPLSTSTTFAHLTKAL